MKFFFLTASVFILANCSDPLNCGQGKIPSKMNTCIEPSYIEGCEQYDSPSTCGQCEIGYKPSSHGCDAMEFGERENKINGCLKKSENKKTCLNCANGFVRRHGKCEPGIKNCDKYSEDNACLECKPDYSLVFNECKYNILLGCRRIKTQDHTCEQCFQPFKLKDSHCEVPNCQALNDYGCVTCQCGYYLNKDRTCIKTEDGCLRYERGRCINCLNHYRLKGGACQIEGCVKYQGNTCIQCKSLYNNIHGGCEFKDCVDWANDQCFSCKQGFKSEQGLCKKEEQFVCMD